MKVNILVVLIKVLLQMNQKSMKNPGLYVLVGKARRKLMHPHM
jgi:hypothetical protein